MMAAQAKPSQQHQQKADAIYEAVEPSNAESDRRARMTPLLDEIVQITTDSGITRKVTIRQAYDWYVHATKSGKLPPARLVKQYLNILQARGLDPDAGDALITGYDSQDGPQFSIVVTYQALAKRAARHPAYDGIACGVIVLPLDAPTADEIPITGSYYNPLRFQLVGAWAKVYRTDKTHVFEARISFASRDKGRATWKSMPADMICKCAKAAAQREAFPLECGDLYVSDEIRADRDPSPMTEQTVFRPNNVTTEEMLGRRERTEIDDKDKMLAELACDLARAATPGHVETIRSSFHEGVTERETIDDINLACDLVSQRMSSSATVPVNPDSEDA